MTVADVLVQEPRSDGPGDRQDRLPPQDVAAEQSVLGAMLLSKDAIADVVEALRGGDFYRPAHEAIFDAVLDLYGKGEPADAVTVSAELTRRGEIGRVGGAAYIHTLISMVPTAANAGYYAEIVRERAVLRRLVEAGTRIVQMGYAGDGANADEIVDRAQAEVYGVTDKRASEDYQPLSAIMEGALDEIEAIGSRGGQLVGVPTGFADLDELTNGLHGGQMVIIAARPAVGKALALDTPLPTPTGWTTMGEVAVGDEVLAADGTPTLVVAATEVMHDRPCYEVHFSDGTVVVADAEHQWVTETRWAAAEVRTTAEIAARLSGATGLDHAVANARPLQLPDRELPVPPYALGAWLGRREAGPLGQDPDDEFEVDAWVEGEVEPDVVGPVATGLGMVHAPHLPTAYLRAGLRQRRDLLAGVLDTLGVVQPSGTVRVRVGSQRLADDLADLVAGLGMRCTVKTRGTGRSATAWLVTLTAEDDVFRLERKRLLHKERSARSPRRRDARFITDVRPVPSVPVRCVQIAHESHLYLAGRAMVPTHNSTLALDFARASAIKNHLSTVFFSLEMGKNEITMRLLSAEARVPLHHMRTGSMTDDDWNRLARRMGEVSEAPLFIDDSPNMTMMEIRAKCRRLKQRHDLKLVIVDYLQLMQSGKRVESRQQEVSEFSRSMKLLAKELDVPVIALSQLNRGPEQRTDKKPMMSDLRESGSLEQDADMVMLLHREDLYEKESPRAGEADIIVAKHRNGPTATITVAFQGHYSRFVDMQS
ncbi:replicative DNA helicase [Motilibacter rhizosphaerae]|uniref:Replicative DNA helicase n=1 Tax=Motilibacter rhizosphaerae TaxID=598652 RepID=A0A4Q7NVJ1_9ACTN|nr:replicative DNA helicase [Motilibacter rhizosphaerae]RZS91154.1 replicative DNA helicase [Motilibacter rhizosphaerae]